MASEVPADEVARLTQQLVEARAHIENLSQELAETNNGVVVLYAEIDDKNAQLREASELKSRFLSYMSHEFRTPLGSIRSICRIMLDQFDGPLTEEQAKQVNFVMNSAVELNEMVNDLLDLAAIEAGRITISPAWFTLVDFFGALRGIFKPILASGETVLIFEEPEDLGGFFTDDKKLSHILRNFISNAIKFTPKGEIRVEALRTSPELVTFVVTDTGIGITEENQKVLFQDFVQLPSYLQRKARGTGLGLSLSRRFAELLGGKVSVESKLGAGSKFSVTIPVKLPGHEPDVAVEGQPHAG